MKPRFVFALTVSMLGFLLGACSADDPAAGTDGASDETTDATMTTTEPSSGTTAGSGGSDAGTSSHGTETSSGTTDSADTGAMGGCGKDPGFTGAKDGALTIAGEQRSFTLVLPASYDSSTPYPIVFAWHGRGGSGEIARGYFGVEEQAGGAAIFVYPDGLPLADMGGQTGWDLKTSGVDVQFFDEMLAQFSDNLCIDAARVFSTGHSFGGYMSNTLGCARGGTVRAIAPVAGGGPYGGCAGAPVAAWLAHGLHDEVVPLAQGEGSRDHWVTENGCSSSTAGVDPVPCVAYDGCDRGFPVHWCTHEEEGLGVGNHTWPSFAGVAIWEFFAAMK